METSLEQIKEAIVQGDIERARELLREELRSNPSAEAYYLGAQIALNDAQKREFLEKAVALDPFHARAYQQLNALREGSALQLAGATYAGGGRRLIAYWIDTFLLNVCTRLLLTGLGGVLPPVLIPAIQAGKLVNQLNPAYLLIALVIDFIPLALYEVYFLSEKEGQTLGKMVMKIRVVSLDGRKITPRQAFMRGGIGYFVSSFVLWIGFIWAFFDKRKQAWHDKLAGTVVVNVI
jgi:uncharacterized RDD family membrane protein YckC